MCGIAGILNLKDGVPPSRNELEGMIHAVHHRGPDGYGYYLSERVGLAHARLSIIDLAGGDQPIHNEDKSVQVVFNGEIFNYVELTAQLKRQGHRFYTHSDTEVIVHLYEEYGEAFVDHLNGQFAIALWDSREGRLILARDRTGIRPLYTIRNGNRFFFSSEVKSLFAHPAIPREINLTALSEVFTFWTTLPPHSLFESVEMIPPGHILVIENGSMNLSRYWDWSYPNEQIDNRKPLADWREELKALMVDSVRLQLRSDVPVGAYLSGGLDSSVLTSLIKNFTDTPLRTFSIGFEDEEFDESGFQQDLVDYLGTNHTHVLCKRSDIGAAFPRVISHTESAIVRTAPTPLMLLSGAVREAGYKVVLTGEGADEVFGGYDIFKEAKVRRFWSHAPDSEWRPLILQRLYPYLKHSPTTSGAFSKRFFQQGMEHLDKPFFAHIPRWATTQRILQFLSDEARAAIDQAVDFETINRILPADIEAWKPLNRDQYIEANTLLSGYLLSSQGDRVAMANSIEGRYPFLDHRVIEFAATLPSRYKIMGLNEKYLLKQTMQGLIPESIRKRSKQPYRAPDSQSFFNGEKPLDYVAYLFSEERIRKAGYYNPKTVGLLLKKCARGKALGFADNMAFVGILSSMLVDELFIEQASIDSH
ncbi:MAG: asparagine synthase (glutamine-hydrolyzing) [Candidatus Thiodiazotropha sp.]|nr:asparagine synthase (glutamine-hydrolyzing) [Candidatus Thiodiazotropha taylori]MBT3064066.1 asparagine synthase (glutamine-hydrolyzing) [Candidatus Thiodiazotropha sp. (ex Lucina pensylvanica)]MBV2097046.1 asparagine synthase (glutamine-hydrolyzing) [Candidatus Thiodiazotropha sp. (ex Codakia orbicularis)]PUB75412.1 MAG: asparagine synthase (glutamine-hydrolyzing) [gamma proteobacterium symbiont of Ctena orbiculata]PUB75930.1 MAG: asparagine synthase (glutamine-hydrolyzing) [gamma proteobac